MKLTLQGVAAGFLWVAFASPLVWTAPVEAARISTATMADFHASPPINAEDVPPLVMLVMSRDEQLYIKAYTDYTDLDGDGVIDATYNDKFSYAGYFGSNLCYTHDGTQFKASAAAGGTNKHSCTGAWSGNFLNWLTMSRMDIVRSVLYGGKRSVDDANRAVLERAGIPNDLHAWAKYYDGADIASFTPFQTAATFCNASWYDNTGRQNASGPRLRYAPGNWGEWASASNSQCEWGSGGNSDRPKQSDGQDFSVKVEVCSGASATREPFCRRYVDTSGTERWKPAGLLQQYGEDGKLRFGLMTGSYGKPRSGGRLRSNIRRFAGNGASITACAPGDEIKLDDGTFCNTGAGTAGIINTLNRLQLVGWKSEGTTWNVSYDNCADWGGRARKGNGGAWVLDNPGGGDRHCSAHGNPLSELYAEALRYIKGESAPTPGFIGGADTTYVAGIPDGVNWIDPYGSETTGAGGKGSLGGGNPYCADCSILVLSTGLNSFDSDEVPSVFSGATARDATDAVGKAEGITGGEYVIGRVLGSDNSPTTLTVGASVNTSADVCSNKFLSRLGDAIGICPDVPSLEGSYYIAGLAHKAATTPLRTLTGPGESGVKRDLMVRTYAVQLAESLPSFSVSAQGGTIQFTPLCQSNSSGNTKSANDWWSGNPNWATCSLGDVRVGVTTARTTGNYTYGRPLLSSGHAGSYYFVWEDSTFGSDRDLDATQVMTWCVGAECTYQSPQTIAGDRLNADGSVFKGHDICWRSDSAVCSNGSLIATPAAGEVLIRSEITSAAGGYSMITGYNISGTDGTDGVVRAVVATNAGPNDSPNDGGGGGMGFYSVLTGANNTPPKYWQPANVVKYKVGASNSKRLQNPLWYAAKYGGFNDQNGNGLPDLQDEWDRINNETGAEGPDGLPDTFFPVHNPSKLGEQLGRALNAIVQRTGSGTAAAVVSNSASGEGLIYQALYNGRVNDDQGNTVDWTGQLHGFWTDSFGHLREDGNRDRKLGNYNEDPVITFFVDAADNNRAKFKRWTSANADTFDYGTATSATFDLKDLRPVWRADDLLNSVTLAPQTQRSYATASSSERHVFTWIDANGNGVVDAGEQTSFTWEGATGSAGFHGSITNDAVKGNFTYLNSDDPEEAEKIVRWIRGEEISGMRSRRTDNKVMRLGDIINSTPAAVATPAEGFDLLYNDASYAEFRDLYRNRRQVVYVGANDGMLHAFNGGFYNAQTQSLATTPATGSSPGPNSPVAHAIGAELWAYVPGNLLPHLRWTTSRDYNHVYYIDGSPIAFDAKIFADDDVHPNGWGTVLVAPFRLGGGEISVPVPKTAGDACSYKAPNATDSGCKMHTSHSAYVVLDVTDPESPPKVLAELTTGSFTTPVPAVAIQRDAQGDSPSKFFLFLASGPTDNGGPGKRTGSTRDLEVTAYDLGQVIGGSITPARTIAINCGGDDPTVKGCFGGDLLASDFDLDNRSEAVYFGSVVDKGSDEYGGGLWKIQLDESESPSNWSAQLVHDARRPVTVRPTIGRNALGQPMIFFGTGRLFSKTDLTTSANQRIYGIVDTGLLGAQGGAPPPGLPLTDSHLLDTSGIVIGNDGEVDNAGSAENFTELLELMDSGDYYGWYRTLRSATGQPAERVVSFQTLLGGILLTSAYTPGTDICTDLGSGRLFGLNYRTGTADPSAAFFGTKDDVVNDSAELGAGLPAPPSLHVGSKGGDAASSDRSVRACIQTSSGAIICEDITTLKSVRSGEISWREPVN